MGQNVTIAGASYPDVPALDVPKTGGGTARFVDTADDTVTPATLKLGATAHDASGAKITGTLDTTPPEESDINFWDYDGTLLYSWTFAEMATKTELPPLPSHDGLVCQGWNWTLQDIKDASRELDIGALYITDDGKTRLYVDVDTETWDDFQLSFQQSAANAVTVNWGDGSAEETSATSGTVNLSHVYQSSGVYVVTLLVAANATMKLSHPLSFGETIADRTRMSMLTKAEIGARVAVISYFAFGMAARMQSITLPTSVTFEGSRIFEQCTALRGIVFPTAFAAYQTFYNDACLRVISTAKGTTQNNASLLFNTAVRRVNFDTIGARQAQAITTVHIKAVNGRVGDFSACRALLEVTIPADATTFVAEAFSGDNALRKVTCLGDIASIPAQVFQRCYPLRFVDLTHCTAVPTLANVNAFDQTHAQLEIRVPAALYDEWKAATNWASLADHIVPVGVAQNGSVLSIFSGVTVTQTGEELQIGG